MMRRKIARREPVSIKEIVNITARQIGPRAKGHSKSAFKSALEGKDWMHPHVQKVLNRYVERYLFETPLTTREKMKSFLEVASEISFGQNPAYLKENLLRHHLIKFVSRLNFKDRHTLLKKIALTRFCLENLKRKLDSVQDISKQEWSNVKVTTNEKKQVHEKDSEYYTANARDAMAHLTGVHAMQFGEVVDELIQISKSMEAGFGRLY